VYRNNYDDTICIEIVNDVTLQCNIYDDIIHYVYCNIYDVTMCKAITMTSLYVLQ